MNFQEKRIKIQTLQQKATEFNLKEDELIDAGKDPVEARKELLYQQTNFGRTTEIKHIPYMDYENVNGVGKNTSQGFKDTHKVNTTYKDFSLKTQQQFQDVKEMRQSEVLKQQYQQKEQEEKEENQKRVVFYTKDHVSQMFDGIPNKDKKSSYQENHQYNADKEKVILKTDLKYHNKKNDINIFTDAFVKHKGTMRK